MVMRLTLGEQETESGRNTHIHVGGVDHTAELITALRQQILTTTSLTLTEPNLT